MSLEELRKQVDEEEKADANAEPGEVETVEEDEPAEEQEAKEGEPESEEESEAEAPNDDFDFEVDGEEPKQNKPTPEQALLFKLTKKQKQLKGAKTEIEQLRDEVEALKAGKAAPAPRQPAPAPQPEVIPFPDLYDAEINGDKQKYSQAVHQYMNAVSQQGQVTAQQQQEAQRQAQIEKQRYEKFATRTAKFIQAHNISEDKVIETSQRGIEALDALTGIQGGGMYLLDSVGDDSEKLAYYFGGDPSRLEQVKKWLEEDNTGLKAIAQMTRLATTKLKPKTSKSKKSLEPDEPLVGTTSSKTNSDLQRRYDKATDFKELSKIRREARERGVKLSNK
jgi:hypothetical protein